MHNQNLGKLGENIASEYLLKKGYAIITKNFKEGYGEIDIVAQEGNTLVFVEVKTRIGDCYGEPVDAILPRKIREIIQTSEFYLFKNMLNRSWRVDVVAIALNVDKSVERIEHFENITL